MSATEFSLASPICEFCGSKNTKFIIAPNGSIHVKCADCMRVYSISTGSPPLDDSIAHGETAVVLNTKDSKVTEVVECEYRLPCGICKLLESRCLEDTDASKS